MPYAQLSRVRMQYFERGQGQELLVLVHGYQASGRIWQLVQAELPELRFRTIAVNNRGAGETDAPPAESDFTIPCFAADLHELMLQLRCAPFTLVGHSLGAATAMQFAVDHPELVRGLVLLDPTDPDGRELDPIELERIVDAVARPQPVPRPASLQLASPEPLPRAASMPPASPEPATSARAEFARLLGADIAAAPLRRLRGSLRSMLTLRLGTRVGSLQMPVLMACGDKDELFPLEMLLETFSKLPKHAFLHVWHGVGHSPNAEVPAEVAALLRRFVEHTLPHGPRIPARAPWL